MRAQIITPLQTVVNKCNSKVDFTYNLNDSKSQYIVGIESIASSKNPSLEVDLRSKLAPYIDDVSFDTIGGWMDHDTDLFHMDAGIKVSDLATALKMAKVNKQKAIYDTKNGIVITF
jgi:hypothetical protein